LTSDVSDGKVRRTDFAHDEEEEKPVEDFVPVMVPKSRVLEVYEFLARPVRAPGDDQPVPGEDDRGQIPWPSEMLERAYRESSPAMKRFFDHLADNPGRAVPISELGKAVGYSPHQLAGTLGAAGRRITNRYKLRWPFGWELGPDGVYSYTMKEDDAAVLRNYRGRR
jgi:hypothetical protein